ncbi:hypothetical protein WOLCODRAFT_167643 [Wolfiporia cocos MD-104 SS10]|uniref:Uncharacterized protein n=1 Tax=Wolfiporia cocos (strain MD-104) TaxID=742152 RepID=A0A2H3JQA1_WOLCO|nr:hypothetical protein WOLCODRAFT_167643 [Wolfiporia cocos MD-104 SS10]
MQAGGTARGAARPRQAVSCLRTCARVHRLFVRCAQGPWRDEHDAPDFGNAWRQHTEHRISSVHRLQCARERIHSRAPSKVTRRIVPTVRREPDESVCGSLAGPRAVDTRGTRRVPDTPWL